MAKQKQIEDTENRSRQWYMDKCYRLKYDLKKSREQIQELKQQIKVGNPTTKTDASCNELEQQLNEQKKINNYLRAEVSRLKQNRPTEKQREIHDKLREENEALKIYQKQFKFYSTKFFELQKENDILKESLKTLVTKNKRIFSHYFEKAQEQEDGLRISFATVLLDFEFMFIFQKLFEMHTFDYIVDRQNPDDKTEADTKILVSICKEWTSEVIKSQIYQTSLNPVKFKKVFMSFVNHYTERNIKQIDERENKEIIV